MWLTGRVGRGSAYCIPGEIDLKFHGAIFRLGLGDYEG